MDKPADRLPANPVGVNVTVTVCANAPALTVKLVGLTVNCAAWAPDKVTFDILSVSVPVLDTVNVCATDEPTTTFPSESETDERLIAGASVADACAEIPLLFPELSTAAILK